MQRFAIFCGISLAIVALASGGMVFAASQNEPQSWMIFRAPDGTACESPCLFGIISGQTTRSEAERKLTEHPTLQNLQSESEANEQPIYGDEDSHLMLILRMNDEDEVVEQRLSLQNGILSFGDALTALGEPQFVRFSSYESTGRISLYYDGHLVISGYHHDQRIDPSDSVQEVELNFPLGRRPIWTGSAYILAVENELPFWPGFGSLTRFIVHPDCRPVGSRQPSCRL